MIYGKLDSGKNSYSRAFRDGEADFSYKDSVTYSIVFKHMIDLNNQSVLFVIIEAPNSTQTGHQFGYRNFYFLDSIDGIFSCIDSIVSDSEIPIGDNSQFEITDIGTNKKALVSSFQSTGNNHFEHTKYFDLIEIGHLSSLFSVDIEYDNSTWKIPEKKRDKCAAERYENSYEIVKGDQEWFDIKVHNVEYTYSRGCLKRYVKSTSDKVFVYLNGEYIERKKE